MSRTLLSGLTFAVLMAAMATPPAAADDAARPSLLLQDAMVDEAEHPELAARRSKGRVKTSDIVIVKTSDASSPK